jgi:hypothetical protein
MQDIQNVIIIKYLLGIIAFLGGCNIAIIVFIAKKYIKRADYDHDRLNKLLAEHDIYHPKSGDTGKV